MASTKAAMPSDALTRILLALIQHSPHVDAVAIDRAQSNEAWPRIEAFLAKVERISATGSFFWRAATAEITASEQVYRIFELDLALPVTLELIAARVHPDDLPLFHERIERARIAVSDVDFQLRLRSSDGSIKHLHFTAQGMRDQAGQLQYIGVVHDVSSRRLSEEAPGWARAAVTHMARITTLGVLAPSIANEVTEPLAGIMNNANTCLRSLAKDPPSLDGAGAAARRALRDVDRANDLVARLRMLVAKKDVTFESLDLNDAIRATVALFSSELQRHRVGLRTGFASDLPRVRGDRLQLQRVVLNLLANSTEAMSDVEARSRDLLISTEPHDGSKVRVTVQDTGAGFHPADGERLFEAFYTTKPTSMGMGLFISRAIIESHRGRLWVESNKSHGATFSFSIPREQS